MNFEVMMLLYCYRINIISAISKLSRKQNFYFPIQYFLLSLHCSIFIIHYSLFKSFLVLVYTG